MWCGTHLIITVRYLGTIKLQCVLNVWLAVRGSNTHELGPLHAGGTVVVLLDDLNTRNNTVGVPTAESAPPLQTAASRSLYRLMPICDIELLLPEGSSKFSHKLHNINTCLLKKI